jgi:membrane-associated phospholipid phosphatase
MPQHSQVPCGPILDYASQSFVENAINECSEIKRLTGNEITMDWIRPQIFGHLWHLLTRLGEVQIVLPVALLTAWAMGWQSETRPHVVRWLVWMLVAIFITTVTKVAFIGWGVGWRSFDFTGVSGHSMFSAAVFPVLFESLASAKPRLLRRLSLLCGCTLALLVGVSRVMVGAHSISEVIAGLLLGGAVSAMVLVRLRQSSWVPGKLVPVVVAIWLVLMPFYAPVAKTHESVTQLALLLSGHSKPHKRIEMLYPAASTHNKFGRPP